MCKKPLLLRQLCMLFVFIFWGLALGHSPTHAAKVSKNWVLVTTKSSVDLKIKDAPKAIQDLFPEKFTSDNIKTFNTNKYFTKDSRTYKVGEDYEKNVQPYAIQYLTGTNQKRSQQIKFTGKIKLKGNALVGTYSYESSYSLSRSSVTFDVTLTAPDLRILNTKESILGSKAFTFYSNSESLAKTDSLIQMGFADDRYISEAQAIHRINQTIGNWLLMQRQLKRGDVKGKSEKALMAMKTSLVQQHYLKRGYVKKNDASNLSNNKKKQQLKKDKEALMGTALTVAQYQKENKELKQDILKRLGIPFSLLQKVNQKASDAYAGKLFAVAVPK